MSIKTEIVKQPNSMYADVSVTNTGGKTQYYRLPAKNADSFALNLKKQEKTNSIISKVAFGVSILTGVIFAKALTKNIKDKTMQFLIGAVGGIIGAATSSVVCDTVLSSRQNTLIKNYKAKKTYIEV